MNEGLPETTAQFQESIHRKIVKRARLASLPDEKMREKLAIELANHYGNYTDFIVDIDQIEKSQATMWLDEAKSIFSLITSSYEACIAQIKAALAEEKSKAMNELASDLGEAHRCYLEKAVAEAKKEERIVIGQILDAVLEDTRKPGRITGGTVVDFEVWGKNILGLMLKLKAGQALQGE